MTFGPWQWGYMSDPKLPPNTEVTHAMRVNRTSSASDPAKGGLSKTFAAHRRRTAELLQAVQTARPVKLTDPRFGEQLDLFPDSGS